MKSWVSALKVFQRPIGSDECKIFSALLMDMSYTDLACHNSDYKKSKKL